MDVSRKLPVPMTADGFPVGIGDTVFIIWNEMRRNKCGRYYAARNLVVYPVNITSLTFERDYEGGDSNQRGGGAIHSRCAAGPADGD